MEQYIDFPYPPSSNICIVCSQTIAIVYNSIVVSSGAPAYYNGPMAHGTNKEALLVASGPDRPESIVSVLREHVGPDCERFLLATYAQESALTHTTRPGAWTLLHNRQVRP